MINADIGLAKSIVAHEWRQFQQVSNEGGRAACQGNWPTFNQMRLSQFLTWDMTLLRSYAYDLDQADACGRNLLTEKYGRMMQSTAPVEYRRSIESHLPILSPERVRRQEAIINRQVRWADDFRRRYPKLGGAMRSLRTSEDTCEATSFETYLRGELSTYGDHTLKLYAKMVDRTARAEANLTEETIRHTVRLAGFHDLDAAEAAQA